MVRIVPRGQFLSFGGAATRTDRLDIAGPEMALVGFIWGLRPDFERAAGRASRKERRSRSEEHTSELQSLMRISYAVFCLKKKKHTTKTTQQRLTKDLENT